MKKKIKKVSDLTKGLKNIRKSIDINWKVIQFTVIIIGGLGALGKFIHTQLSSTKINTKELIESFQKEQLLKEYNKTLITQTEWDRLTAKLNRRPQSVQEKTRVQFVVKKFKKNSIAVGEVLNFFETIYDCPDCDQDIIEAFKKRKKVKTFFNNYHFYSCSLKNRDLTREREIEKYFLNKPKIWPCKLTLYL